MAPSKVSPLVVNFKELAAASVPIFNVVTLPVVAVNAVIPVKVVTVAPRATAVPPIVTELLAN